MCCRFQEDLVGERPRELQTTSKLRHDTTPIIADATTKIRRRDTQEHIIDNERLNRREQQPKRPAAQHKHAQHPAEARTSALRHARDRLRRGQSHQLQP